MVLFAITLAVLVVVGVLCFKSQATDPPNIEPGMGCAGIALLGAAFLFLLGVALQEFDATAGTFFFIILPLAGVTGVLYAPFIASVFSSFFESLIFPGGGAVKKTHDIAEKLTAEGRYTEAVAEYEKAIEEDPEEVDARLFLADVYLKMDKYELAARTLTDALELDLPAEQWCHIANRLADVFVRKMGEPHEAVRMLNRIAKKYPKTKFARYARERIERIKGS